MTPARKKPCCQTCGSPMEGHKRPNGSPICPIHNPATDSPVGINNNRFPSPSIVQNKDGPSASAPPGSPSPLRRESAGFIIPTDLGPHGFVHRRNPNWVEPVPTRRSDSFHRPDTPMTWVSTEPADDIPAVKREIGQSISANFHNQTRRQSGGVVLAQQLQQCRSDSISSSSSSSSNSSTPSMIYRSLTQALSTSVPLLSIFRTPMEDVSRVTGEARRQGMYTGLLQRPRRQPPLVKREDSDEGFADMSPNGNAINGPQSEMLVVIGQDMGEVMHLIDLQERENIGLLQYKQDGKDMAGSFPPQTTVVNYNLGGSLTWLLLGVIGTFLYLSYKVLDS
ncbi:hypothetical protein C8Q75DRAFT_743246 [Abortiporus biennis]|nr:hypothetical protein C8Q75DRAFT_743246 [Abortiporus biennis]